MFWNCVLKGPLKYVLLMKLHAVITFLVTVNLLWEAHNAGLDSLGYSFFFFFVFSASQRCLHPASSSGPSRRHCWRRDDTWCRSPLRRHTPDDSLRQTEVTVEAEAKASPNRFSHRSRGNYLISPKWSESCLFMANNISLVSYECGRCVATGRTITCSSARWQKVHKWTCASLWRWYNKIMQGWATPVLEGFWYFPLPTPDSNDKQPLQKPDKKPCLRSTELTQNSR